MVEDQKFSQRKNLVDRIVSLSEKSGISRSGIKIIGFLTSQDEAQSVDRIASKTQVAKTKIYHILKNLERKGIVQAVDKWPKTYMMKDLESVVRNILEEGLSKIRSELRTLEISKSQLENMAGEIENIAKGKYPSGISASVFRETSPIEYGVNAIYSKIIENEIRMKKEYRAIVDLTIFEVPDDRIKYESVRKWKELHKQRIIKGVKAYYVCYLDDSEKYVRSRIKNSDARERLEELERNLLDLKNLNVAFSDRLLWGSILVWDDWTAFLLSPLKDISGGPQHEGISIGGKAAVGILKEQFDTFFESVVEANLVQLFKSKENRRKESGFKSVIEDIGKLPQKEKMEFLKESSLLRIRNIIRQGHSSTRRS